MKEYCGTLFDSTVPHGRAPATMRCAGGSILVHSERIEHSWSLLTLDLFRGGAADKLIFFRPQGQTALSFCTDDDSVLADADFCASPVLAAKVLRLRRDAIWMRVGVSAAILLLISLLATAVWGVISHSDPLWSELARSVPPKVERRLGDALFPQLERQFPSVSDSKLEGEFKEFSERLFSSIPDKSFEFTTHIAMLPDVNAFALPGGHIVAFSGLLLEAQTPEEILGVLAHEAAHVTERHVMRHLVRALGVGTTFSLLFGDATGTLAGVGQLGDLLLSRSYSRELEREADARGISYLLAANIDPRGLLTFFERLMRKSEIREKRRGGDESQAKRESKGRYSEATRDHVKMLELALSTHPEHAERIRRLQSLTAVGGSHGYKAVDFDLKTFQQRLVALEKGE